jgi:hypothetical protein
MRYQTALRPERAAVRAYACVAQRGQAKWGTEQRSLAGFGTESPGKLPESFLVRSSREALEGQDGCAPETEGTDLLVRAGIFKSVSDAGRREWNKPVPKRRFRVVVLGPMNP